MVALYNKEEKNYEFLVDYDAARSSTGADGIEHSIKKLGFTSFKLNDQATDSGRGTTLQKLWRKLEEKRLTAIGYRVSLAASTTYKPACDNASKKCTEKEVK